MEENSNDLRGKSPKVDDAGIQHTPTNEKERISSRMRTGLLYALFIGLPIATVVVLSEYLSNFIKLLSIIVSFPFAIGAIIITFMLLFKKEIPRWIEQGIRAKTPGGYEIELIQRQQPESRDDSPAEEARLKISQEDLDAYQELVAAQMMEQGALFQSELQGWQQLALHWRIRYLQVFLAPASLYTLWVMAHSPVPITTDNYNIAFHQHVPSPEQRYTIAQVLLAEGLVRLSGSTYEVTQSGWAFLNLANVSKPPPGPWQVRPH